MRRTFAREKQGIMRPWRRTTRTWNKRFWHRRQLARLFAKLGGRSVDVEEMLGVEAPDPWKTHEMPYFNEPTMGAGQQPGAMAEVVRAFTPFWETAAVPPAQSSRLAPFPLGPRVLVPTSGQWAAQDPTRQSIKDAAKPTKPVSREAVFEQKCMLQPRPWTQPLSRPRLEGSR